MTTVDTLTDGKAEGFNNKRFSITTPHKTKRLKTDSAIKSTAAIPQKKGPKARHDKAEYFISRWRLPTRGGCAVY